MDTGDGSTWNIGHHQSTIPDNWTHEICSRSVVFASIVNSYNKSDVFNCQALVIASHYATAVEETGMHILYWRQELDKKYTQLAGIRQYHDFFASRNSSGNSVMKVKEECGSGDYKVDRLKLRRGSKPQDECFPDPTCNYVPKFSAFTHI